MSLAQTVCNYALLRFLRYPETGEFANVGVLVMCESPCLIDFMAEEKMPARVKALFPQQSEVAYQALVQDMGREMRRVKAQIREPHTCALAFREVVRPRESTLRFGEVRTLLTPNAHAAATDLFRRYVRMEAVVSRAEMAATT